MQAPHSQQYLTYQTTQCKLNITFTGQKLMLQLEDYIDWVIYSRGYTNQDIGKQIHQKTDLNDLFQVFLSYKIEHDRKRIRKMENKFGEVVYANQNPCFKIDHKGIITIFVYIQKKNPKQQLIKYQSILHLYNKSNIDHTQFCSIKSAKQIKIDLLSKIQILNIQNLQLKNQNKDIKTKLEDLQNGYNILQQKLLKTQKYSSQQHQFLKIKINQIQDMFEMRLAQYQAQIINLKEQSQDQKSIMQNYKQKSEIQNLKVKQQNQNVSYFSSDFQISKNNVNQSRLPRQILNFFTIANLRQPYHHKFKIYPSETNCRIEYIGQNSQTQFIFNQVIPSNTLFSFKIKILKTKNRDIMIGIVNQSQLTQRCSYKSKSAISYYGFNGTKLPTDLKQGGGFKEGQIIQTRLDLINKTVWWIVNGVVRATHTFYNIIDDIKKFRPYIQMYETHDTIAITI